MVPKAFLGRLYVKVSNSQTDVSFSEPQVRKTQIDMIMQYLVYLYKSMVHIDFGVSGSATQHS